jgi:hypothetical protein
MLKEQLKKAVHWIEKKCFYQNFRVVSIFPKGYARLIAHIFRMKRQGKPSVWYLVRIDGDHDIASVKRICTY